MLRSFQRDVDKPIPDQPNVVGEFFLTPQGYVCGKCYQLAQLVHTSTRYGIRCVTPDCSQEGILYEPERAWLPRAQPKPAPARE